MKDMKFLKIKCEVCGSINYHPIEDNQLILNEDDDRRCVDCGRIISRDSILQRYFQTSKEGLTA